MATLDEQSSLTDTKHTFTTRELLEYNAAGVDPYLVLVAQNIGVRFKIAPQGQRNLVQAFASIPGSEAFNGQLGVGFSDRHIAKLIGSSNDGFSFLAVLGCLSEYFAQDVVVEVLLKLVTDLQLPAGYEPSGTQWKTLVHACHGVLATSTFGTLIKSEAGARPRESTHISITRIVKSLVQVASIASGDSERATIENAGIDACWISAVAEYLFDINVVVLNTSGLISYSNCGAEAENAQLIVRSEGPGHTSSSNKSTPSSLRFPNTATVTGGRVRWDHLFRSCFGKAYTGIDPSLIANFIGGAASIVAHAFDHDQIKAQAFFLPHASTVRGLSGYGLVETLTSWFPELQSLAPRMGKSARLSFQEARDKMDEATVALDANCMCNHCGNAPDTSTEFCHHSILQTMMLLGLFIARTVVVPNLFPKKTGVIGLHDRCHASRPAYKARGPPAAELFIKELTGLLPTSRDMIETMCLLFTSSVPSMIKDTSVSLSYEGISMFIDVWNPNLGARDLENEQLFIRQRAGITVSSGSMHVQGRIYSHGYWEPSRLEHAETDDQKKLLSFSDTFELLRTRPKEFRTIVKPKMGDLVFSHIRVGEKIEDKARKSGWLVMR